jgi:hypothetical protein
MKIASIRRRPGMSLRPGTNRRTKPFRTNLFQSRLSPTRFYQSCLICMTGREISFPNSWARFLQKLFRNPYTCIHRLAWRNFLIKIVLYNCDKKLLDITINHSSFITLYTRQTRIFNTNGLGKMLPGK